jgi:hypothetical protein
MKKEYTDILFELKEAFKSFRRPDIIYTIFDYDEKEKIDTERLMIQKDFANVDRINMDRYQCSMMIIDSALIADEAYFYFMPRLAESVISEYGDEVLFLIRLKKLDKRLLNKEQLGVFEKLITLIEQIEMERDKKE